MSLILLDWNIEWNGGTENGLIYVVTHLICATGTVQFDLCYLLYMSLGSYMYCNVSKSNVACWDTSLSDNITVRKWGFPYYRDPLDPSSATKYI